MRYQNLTGIEMKPKLIGYLVHLPGRDEFLNQSESMQGAEYRSWTTEPELAFIYKTKRSAECEVKQCGPGAIVVTLHETDDNYVIEIA